MARIYTPVITINEWQQQKVNNYNETVTLLVLKTVCNIPIVAIHETGWFRDTIVTTSLPYFVSKYVNILGVRYWIVNSIRLSSQINKISQNENCTNIENRNVQRARLTKAQQNRPNKLNKKRTSHIGRCFWRKQEKNKINICFLYWFLFFQTLRVFWGVFYIKHQII